MSHEISEVDRHEGTSQAWHGLTVVTSVITLATCWLAQWDVRIRALFRSVNRATALTNVKLALAQSADELATLLATESRMTDATERNAIGKEIADVRATQTEHVATLAALEGNTSDTVMEKTGTCELTATDNEAIAIGKPFNCRTYTVLSNARFLGIVQSALDTIHGATVASVLSVCRRARIAVALAIPRMDSLAGAIAGETFKLQAAGREFQFYLNFLSSHDKSAPFTVVLSTVCTVCNNTFSINLTDETNAKLRIRIPHTSGMNVRLANVPAIVGAFFTSAQRFADTMHALSLVPITALDAKAFFAGLVTENDDASENTDADVAELSSRRLNQIDRLLSLFVSGKGNSGANLADVFSAVTDYYSHENAGKVDPSRQVASSEFGDGQEMKAFAFAILRDDKRIAATIANGHKVLAASADE